MLERKAHSYPQEKRRKYWRSAQIVLVLASLAIIFSLLGKSVPWPWELTATVEDGVCSAESDDGEAIIDEGMARILFLNDNDRIVNIQSYGLLTTESVLFNDMEASPWGFYVLENVNSGVFIEKERLVHYSAQGKRLKEVLSLEYDTSVEHYMEKRLQGITCYEGKGYLTKKNADDSSVTVLEFDLGSDDSGTAQGGEAAEVREFAVFQNAAGGEAVYYSLFFPQKGALIAEDPYGYLYESDASSGPVKITDEPATREIDAITIDEEGNLAVLSGSDLDGEEYLCSPVLIAESLLFFAAVVFLVVLLIVKAVLAAVRIARERTDEQLKKLKTVVIAAAVFIGAVALVGVYSLNLSKQNTNLQQGYIATSTVEMKGAMQEEFTKALDEYDAEATVSADLRDKIVNRFTDISVISNDRGLPRQCVLFYYTETDGAVGLVAPDCQFQTGARYPEYTQLAEECMGNDAEVTEVVESLWGAYIVSAISLDNSQGEAHGVLATYSDNTALKKGQLIFIFGILFAILSVAISVAFVVVEGREWAKSFSAFRKYRAQKVENVEFALVRPLFFLTVGMISTGNSLAALIAKDLLAGGPYADNAVLLGVPITAMYLGVLIGLKAYDVAARKLGKTKVELGSVILAIASYALTAFFVLQGSFVLFTVCVVLSTIFSGMVESGVYRSIVYAPNDAVRAEANRATSTTAVSATSLMGLAAGYAATGLGNYAVYLVSIVPGLAIVAIYLFFIIPSRKGADRDERTRAAARQKTSIKDMLRFLLAPSIASLILCVILVMAMTGGYKSLLFPLFADAEGLSKSMINAVVVFGNAAVFFIAPAFAKAEKSMGYRKPLLIWVAVCAFGFGMFLVNDSILWAIIMLVLLGMADKASMTCWRMSWHGEARRIGISEESGELAIRSSDKCADIIVPPLLGAILNFGKITACGIIAVYMAASAVIYGFATKKEKNP